MKNIPFDKIREQNPSLTKGLDYIEDWIKQHPDEKDFHIPDYLSFHEDGELVIQVCVIMPSLLEPDYFTPIYKLRTFSGDLLPNEYNEIEDIPDELGDMDLAIFHRRK